MMDLSHAFDQAIGMAIARGLRPGPWRTEIERRFIAARLSGDEPSCRRILQEWQSRIAVAETEQREAEAAERRAARLAERDRAAAELAAKDVVQRIEEGGWRRLSVRADGTIMLAGAHLEDEILLAALIREATAIRALLQTREKKTVLIPAPAATPAG